jgi:hypothetical protein
MHSGPTVAETLKKVEGSGHNKRYHTQSRHNTFDSDVDLSLLSLTCTVGPTVAETIEKVEGSGHKKRYHTSKSSQHIF